MALQTEGIVINNVKIKSNYYLLDIHCSPIANQIKAGQFIMLKVSKNYFPILRRPFSIYKSYPDSYPEKKKKGQVSILYKIVGIGTQMMTEFKKGHKLDLIGPLGNGFALPIPSSSTTIILIGGGVGIVSLHPLAEVWKGKELIVFIGGKTRDDILCAEDFNKLNSKIFIATEDGTLGFKGTVIELFEAQKKKFKKNGSIYIYSCGPTEMLKQLSKKVKSERFITQVSLESRMGCGFGACWGCVVKTNNAKIPYQRVCKEGPAFYLEDIDWS